jgi:glycosyltransferase involved in cell wall biosynthesis
MSETKPKTKKKKVPAIVFDEHMEDSQEDTETILPSDSVPEVAPEPVVVGQTVNVINDNYVFQNTHKPLKIVFIIHGYADTMGSGAERMVQTISRFLVDRGHEVTVAVKRPKGDSDGKVKIVQCKTKAFEDSVKDYDVVVSHLDLTNYAMELAREHKKPYIWICHNTNKSAYVTISKRPKYAAVVYNAVWVKDTMDFPNNHFILTPPCDYRLWDDGEDHYGAEYITLINHNSNKGGSVLIRIAREMPERKFLAVEGSYDIQVMDRTLPNVKYIKQQQDMKTVYKQTRLLIVPSMYESWGLVYNEAAASGIPAIVHPTEGLKENAGDAAEYADRGDVDQWVAAIKKFDDKDFYRSMSNKARQRSRQQDPNMLLEQFETWIHGIWESYNK